MSGFVYLASQSPRRSQLLDQIGVRHELLLPDADEDAEALEVVLANESPRDYVQRVTQAKTDAALQRWQMHGLPSAAILCADTTVALGAQILGKPVDAEDAAVMLRALSGQWHEVLTAVVLASPATGTRQSACNISRVLFDDLTDDRIADYIATGEPFGKAGAYGIQGAAALLIQRIEGSFSGIMGLPLFEVGEMLRAGGASSYPAAQDRL